MSVKTCDLERLTQPVAAWLAGLSPRSVRDAADLPRNADRSYNARDVLAWAARRLPRPTLSDGETERLLVVADEIAPMADDRLPAMLEALDALRAKYGEHVLLLLWDEVLSTWREEVALTETDEGVRQRQAEEERRRAAEEAARRRLAVAVQCERCGRVRRGRKWTKGGAPAGHAVTYSICPACSP